MAPEYHMQNDVMTVTVVYQVYISSIIIYQEKRLMMVIIYNNINNISIFFILSFQKVKRNIDNLHDFF